MTNRALWGGFAWDAEDFFISYLEMCKNSFLHNHQFLIGHSIELFLKAIFIEQTGDVDGAMGYRHNIKSLFRKCQTSDRPFMPDFEFKGTFEELSKLSERVNKNLIDNKVMVKGFTPIEEEKFLHFMNHIEFYLISENLVDLKYYHTPWLSKSPIYKFMATTCPRLLPNPYWIEFVKKVENYLGYTSKDIEKRFERYDGELSINTKSWLSELYK